MNELLAGMLLAQAQPAAQDAPAVPAGPRTLFETFGFSEELSRVPTSIWLTLLFAILGGVVLGKIAHSVLNALAQRLEQRGWKIRATFFESAAGPASLTILTLGIWFGLEAVFASMKPAGAEAAMPAIQSFGERIVHFLWIFSLAWFFYNLIDIIDFMLVRITAKTDSKLDDQIVPLVRKTLRIFLVIVFGLFVADNVFGADIGAWLAGLGIAGLAVSLAAQESIKNVFGSLTILMDQPFRLGDRIVLDEYDGTVMEIGFRSTKMRLLTGEVVTVPNSKMVDGIIKNMTRRLSIRRVMDVTVTYDTPPEKVEEATQIIKQILAEPEIVAGLDLPDNPPRVSFDNFNSDSLNIKVFYWFRPVDWWAYLDHAQKLNMMLLRRFNEAGIDFAFPTQTLYLAGDQKRELNIRMLEGSLDGSGVSESAGNGSATV